MDQPSRRHLLRQETSASHEAVDAAVGSLDSLAAYKSYLRGMAAFRQAVETALAGIDWPTDLHPWRPLDLKTALDADLADLDLPPPSALPRLEILSDRASLIGTLYVLEGSSMGARLLLKQARALGLSETHGARHLALQTGDSERWRGFVAVLDQPDDTTDDGRMLAAARLTFDAARRAFMDHADA